MTSEQQRELLKLHTTINPEDKVKEYIQRASDFLIKEFPDIPTIQIIDDTIAVAQMLQREEHFNSSNTPHTK